MTKAPFTHSSWEIIPQVHNSKCVHLQNSLMFEKKVENKCQLCYLYTCNINNKVFKSTTALYTFIFFFFTIYASQIKGIY